MEKKTILIVEDEKSLLDILERRLAQDDYVVEKASDGEEGLRMALEIKPDLVLLDILMPKMDGISVLKKLRTDEWGRTVPVIMLTNLTDAERSSEALEGRVTDYLIKSDWRIDDLAEKVRSVLR